MACGGCDIQILCHSELIKFFLHLYGASLEIVSVWCRCCEDNTGAWPQRLRMWQTTQSASGDHHRWQWKHDRGLRQTVCGMVISSLHSLQNYRCSWATLRDCLGTCVYVTHPTKTRFKLVSFQFECHILLRRESLSFKMRQTSLFYHVLSCLKLQAKIWFRCSNMVPGKMHLKVLCNL